MACRFYFKHSVTKRVENKAKNQFKNLIKKLFENPFEFYENFKNTYLMHNMDKYIDI